MLHQIRKIVSFVVIIFKNIITNDIVKDVLSLNKINISTPPGLGLSLHHVIYFDLKLIFH